MAAGALLGERIGIGRRSNVHAYGQDSVVKVPFDGVPAEWAGFEANLSDLVHRAGLPAPEVRDVVEIEGRNAVVFARIWGPSMWEQMLERPLEIEPLARELAAIQRVLLGARLPAGLPDFVDRLIRRIRSASALNGSERTEAIRIASSLPRGAALLHGDLHPGNVLMSAEGPIVIDWFDVAIGHPVADIVRSSLLIRPGSSTAGHLPGATPDALRRLHDAYLDDVRHELDAAATELRAWQAVVATGRLAENAEDDETRLLRLWRSRDEPGPPDVFSPSRAAS